MKKTYETGSIEHIKLLDGTHMGDDSLRGFFRQKSGSSKMHGKSDIIHSEFLETLNITFKGLEQIQRMLDSMYGRTRKNIALQKLLRLWMIDAPRLFFEGTFMEDEQNVCFYSCIIENSTIQDGKTCAYLSQAFMLWMLKQKLTHNDKYEKRIRFSFQIIEDVITNIFGEKNAISHYIKYFSTELGVESEKIDATNWGTFYVTEIAHILIKDKVLYKDVLTGLDMLIFLRAIFTQKSTEFFVGVVEAAKSILNAYF